MSQLLPLPATEAGPVLASLPSVTHWPWDQVAVTADNNVPCRGLRRPRDTDTSLLAAGLCGAGRGCSFLALEARGPLRGRWLPELGLTMAEQLGLATSLPLVHGSGHGDFLAERKGGWTGDKPPGKGGQGPAGLAVS